VSKEAYNRVKRGLNSCQNRPIHVSGTWRMYPYLVCVLICVLYVSGTWRVYVLICVLICVRICVLICVLICILDMAMCPGHGARSLFGVLAFVCVPLVEVREQHCLCRV